MGTEQAEPTVLICDGCGCLVADVGIHERVCAGAGGRVEPAAVDVITEWLDSLDPAEIEKAAFANASMDDNPTTAVFAELRRRAEALR